METLNSNSIFGADLTDILLGVNKFSQINNDMKKHFSALTGGIADTLVGGKSNVQNFSTALKNAINPVLTNPISSNKLIGLSSLPDAINNKTGIMNFMLKGDTLTTFLDRVNLDNMFTLGGLGV